MKKYDKFSKKEYNGTDFLKDIQSPKEGAGMLDSEFDVNLCQPKFGQPEYLYHDYFIVRVLHDIASLQNTKKLYWYETSDLRHYIESTQHFYGEHYKLEVEGDKLYTVNAHGYVQRDKITAAAIMIGIPVKLDVNDKSKNQIGLRMSRSTLRKFKQDFWNVVDRESFEEWN